MCATIGLAHITTKRQKRQRQMILDPSLPGVTWQERESRTALIKTMLIKYNKKREAALKNEAALFSFTTLNYDGTIAHKGHAANKKERCKQKTNSENKKGNRSKQKDWCTANKKNMRCKQKRWAANKKAKTAKMKRGANEFWCLLQHEKRTHIMSCMAL